MSDTSLIFDVLARDKATATLARVSGSVRTAGTAGHSAGLVAAAGFRVAEASAAAWAVTVAGSLVPAIYLVPAAVGATLGAVAGFRVATFGLAAAWKATGQAMTAGGVAGTDVAQRLAAAQWQVQSATHALADAQRNEHAAQLALNDAYATAAQRLEQLNRDLTGAQLDEEQAALAVSDALKALNAARNSGDVSQIQRADLAYRQALHTLDDAKARTQDLSAEQAKASAVGVNGSTEVQQAQQQLADAQWQTIEASHQLVQAQQAVADATRGSSAATNAAALAMAKLSPNARDLITTLHQLGPAWTSVRQASQDAALAHVAGDMRALSEVYLPVLRTRLVQMGAGFNAAVRESLGLARSRRFVADIDTTLANTTTSATMLGRAFTPIVDGTTQLGAVGSQFLPQIAGWVYDLGTDFQRWVTAARESGQLQQWMGQATAALHSVWDVGTNVLHIVMAILHAGADGGAGNGLLATLDQGTAKMAAFLNSAKGQEQIKRVFSDLRSVLGAVADILPTVAGHAGEFTDTLRIADPIVHTLADHAGLLAAALPYLATGYVIAKTASIGFKAVEAAKLPILALNAAATWGLRPALKAHTAALRENTAATRVSTVTQEGNTLATTESAVAQERGVIATAASKVAMFAASAATKAYAVAQWALNVAMDANPIGLIIIAIVALVAGIVLLWQHSEAFRNFWIAVWDWIKNAALDVAHWFTGPFVGFWAAGFHWVQQHAREAADWVEGRFNAFIGFFTGLPGRITTAARGLFNGLIADGRAGFNTLIGLWNRLDFGINVHVPSWVPLIGGNSFTVPDIIPDLPYLANGGVITSAGAAVVGDGGEPEIVDLPAGARVTPLSRARGDAAGGSHQTALVWKGRSNPEALEALFLSWLMKAIRTGDLVLETS